jgi:serine/threonine protein kinase
VTAETFGHYRLEGLIGRGGMGEIHRAFDTVKKRVVALKRLPRYLATDSDFQARFRHEAKVAAQLREPHVIPIHDFGEIEGQLFLDMLLVEGIDLGAHLARHGPLPPDRAVDVVGQVAEALDAAHAEDLVHSNVKPSNVLLARSERGDADHVYLVDFGIMRAAGETRGTSTTAGSLAYMAPERFLGTRVDSRIDTGTRWPACSTRR